MRLENDMSDGITPTPRQELRNEVHALREQVKTLTERNAQLELGPKAYAEPVEAEEIREMLRGMIDGGRIRRSLASEMMEALGVSSLERVRVTANLVAEFTIQIDTTLLNEEEAKEAIAAHLRSQVEFDEEGYGRYFQVSPLSESTTAEIEVDSIEISEGL